jgi:hypothetical protein
MEGQPPDSTAWLVRPSFASFADAPFIQEVFAKVVSATVPGHPSFHCGTVKAVALIQSVADLVACLSPRVGEAESAGWGLIMSPALGFVLGN